jgi:hypothetical protein
LFNVEVLNSIFRIETSAVAFSGWFPRFFQRFLLVKNGLRVSCAGRIAVSYSTSPCAEIPPGAELLTSREFRLAGMNKSRFVHFIKKTDTTAEKMKS